MTANKPLRLGCMVCSDKRVVSSNRCKPPALSPPWTILSHCSPTSLTASQCSNVSSFFNVLSCIAWTMCPSTFGDEWSMQDITARPVAFINSGAAHVDQVEMVMAKVA